MEKGTENAESWIYWRTPAVLESNWSKTNMWDQFNRQVLGEKFEMENRGNNESPVFIDILRLGFESYLEYLIWPFFISIIYISV